MLSHSLLTSVTHLLPDVRFPQLYRSHKAAHVYLLTYLPGEQASSRLHYVALNMLRVDKGNPQFGRVAAVFSPSFWSDAVAATPVDSGLYEGWCNKTYIGLPGSTHSIGMPVACASLEPSIPFFAPYYPYTRTRTLYSPNPSSPIYYHHAQVECASLNPSPGTLGHIDHVLLSNARAWAGLITNSTTVGGGQLGRLFSRWHGDSSRWTDISAAETATYIESNVLAQALFSERSITLYIGCFASLFGTARGKTLQLVASSRGIALAWAIGDGTDDQGFATYSAYDRAGFDGRLLDASIGNLRLVNTSLQRDLSSTAFARAWALVAAARATSYPELPEDGPLPRGLARGLWPQVTAMLGDAALLGVRAPATCGGACIGRSARGGACVCYLE